MADYKIIHDTVHGSIKLDGLFLELLETPEIQRLHGIHQLGLAYLVFPGANHTRLEHSIGTCHVAGRLADALGLDEGEKRLVMAAGMLHDIGHAPYSHTLEIAMHDKTKLDHMDITKDIILGKRGIKLDGGEEGRIPNLLEKYEVVPKEVAGLISGLNPDESVKTLKDFSTHEDQVFFNDKKYLDHIIHGTIDSDQIDYLLRDSHYTGVAHGTIDMDRLIQTVELFNNDLVVNRMGCACSGRYVGCAGFDVHVRLFPQDCAHGRPHAGQGSGADGRAPRRPAYYDRFGSHGTADKAGRISKRNSSDAQVQEALQEGVIYSKG
jgi:HD superfamily phosphohydrolase